MTLRSPFSVCRAAGAFRRAAPLLRRNGFFAAAKYRIFVMLYLQDPIPVLTRYPFENLSNHIANSISLKNLRLILEVFSFLGSHDRASGGQSRMTTQLQKQGFLFIFRLP
jgi:hypothetical protein